MAIAKPASVRGQRKRGQEINDRAERNGEQFALNKIPYLIAAYFWSAYLSYLRKKLVERQFHLR
jgi:hypothetical protein